MAFLETGAFVGLIAPGEFTVIIGGVVAGQGEIDIVPLIGLAWFCCVLGDSASFFLGHKLGRAFLVKHGPKVRIDEETLKKVESYFDRHGGKTVLIGRFIGLVRAVAPFVAGSSGMRYRQFLPFSILGTGLWATTFSLLGFFFYRSFEQVANYAGPGDARVRHAGGDHRRRRLGLPPPARGGAARSSWPGSTARAGARCCGRSPRSCGRSGGGVVRPAARVLAPRSCVPLAAGHPRRAGHRADDRARGVGGRLATRSR